MAACASASEPISTNPNPFERLVSRSTMTCALWTDPNWREQRLQVGLVDVVSQVADIQLLTHDRTPKRKADDPRDAFRVEKKGASVEAHWVDKTGEKHRPDREDPAVPLGRQTNRPKDNKKWKGLIENSG